MRRLSVETAPRPRGERLLAPLGVTTPHDAIAGLSVDGGRIQEIATDAELGLAACLIEAEGGPLALHYTVEAPPPSAGYPEAAFAARETPYTTAATALADASRRIAEDAGGGGAGLAALVAEAESRFAYAHPEHAFNEGAEAIPHLSCGTTPGSCVDINTYLIASLRAAGYEAAYVFGYFFPEERAGVTDDMHCWVVTRCAGEVLAWDVAHHMKAGLGRARPALNPRPGERVALGHSMGHRYRLSAAPPLLKLLAEPLTLGPDGAVREVPLSARLQPSAAAQRRSA
ncbi:MAG: transglutaminase family protein [Alphaproteobacteria bacterium]|nr:transglutaminase family protein [Alphaproteobacteria bacterium]